MRTPYMPYIISIFLGDLAAVAAFYLGVPLLGYFLLASTFFMGVMLVVRHKIGKNKQFEAGSQHILDEGK